MFATVIAAAAALAAAGTAAQAPPAEAFAALPAMDSPSLSADGERLAFISHTGANSYVLVANLDDMSIAAGVDTAEAKPRDVFWVDEKALVFAAGITESLTVVPGFFEVTSPYGVDLTGGTHVTQLLRDRARLTRRGGGAARIGGFLTLDGAQLVGFQRETGRVLYPKFDAEADRVLYAVDPKNDNRRIVDNGNRFTADWVVDETGGPVFRLDYNERRDRFTLLGRKDGRWEVVVSKSVEIPDMNMHGLSAGGELLVSARPDDAQTYGLYPLLTETGELGEPIFSNDRYDMTTVVTDPYTNRVVGAAIAGVETVWFDEDLARHQELIDGAFPDEAAGIASWSEDRQRLIVLVTSGTRAPGIYLYDAREASVKQIGSVHTSLLGVALPPRREHSYTARDGTTIPGFLTRPLNAEGPTPAIVLPHGGPASRDVAGFDWLAQFLASRGYTVLQPNFRGSRGFGRAWEEAGHGEWGTGVMQHDLSDGVAALVEAGLADPERVCIVGASYGGYAALAGAVFTPELYRCAAAIAPVSDLNEMLSFEDNRRGGFSSIVSYWQRAIGGDDDHLRARSPAEHAERVEAPILLVHGRDDSVVPLQQSRAMERALRDAGKRVELIELDGEDHWLSRPPTRLAAMQALERFLGEHLAE